MRKGRVIPAAVVAAAAGGLLAGLLWPARCPIEVRVAGVYQSGILDDVDAELLTVSLSVSNRDRVDVMFEAAKGFETKSAMGDWIPVKYAFTVSRISPGQQTSVLLLAPPATAACRLRLRYQTGVWKSRVMGPLGARGRTLVAKSHLLRKLVWPDELKTMPVPPHWKQTTIEAIFPNTAFPSAGTHDKPVASDVGTARYSAIGSHLPAVPNPGRGLDR
jgi:hypothetical protein